MFDNTEFEDHIRRRQLLEKLREGTDPDSIDWTYNPRYLTELPPPGPVSTDGVLLANKLAMPRGTVVHAGFLLLRRAAEFGETHALCRELGQVLLYPPPRNGGCSTSSFPCALIRRICDAGAIICSTDIPKPAGRPPEVWPDSLKEPAAFFTNLKTACADYHVLQLLSAMEWSGDDIASLEEMFW